MTIKLVKYLHFQDIGSPVKIGWVLTMPVKLHSAQKINHDIHNKCIICCVILLYSTILFTPSRYHFHVRISNESAR